MKHFIFNKERMDFRYSSGTTIYNEKLWDSRLVSINYCATVMPPHDHDCVMEAPVCAFDLAVDGKDATFGWEFENWDTKEDDSGRADLKKSQIKPAVKSSDPLRRKRIFLPSYLYQKLIR